MPSELPLGRYLLACWAELEINQVEFARRANLLPAQVHQFRVGLRKPPLHQLQRWARALELKQAKDIARLQELMQLAHALPATQEAYERLREQVYGSK